MDGRAVQREAMPFFINLLSVVVFAGVAGALVEIYNLNPEGSALIKYGLLSVAIILGYFVGHLINKKLGQSQEKQD